MHLTTIAGAGALRGADYGRLLGSEVRAAAAALKQQMAASGHPPGPLGRRLATGPLARTAAEWTPDLWEETLALARSSHVDLEDVLLLVFLDEGWGLTRQAGCSVIGRTLPGRPGGPDTLPVPPTTELGQTMDLPTWTDGRARILRIIPGDSPVTLVLAFAGSPGLCGANAAGLAVAVNALRTDRIDEDGLAVAYITRHLLTLATIEGAEAFLRAVPHAAGQAYSLAASDGLATFEAGPGFVRRITPPGVAAIAHTNHDLSPEASPSRPPTESSRERLDLLTRALQQHAPLAEVLTEDVIVDGERWRDRHVTFGAFRAVGSEPVVRFIDGAEVRAGRREWARISFG